jgi:hypothetical protein
MELTNDFRVGIPVERSWAVLTDVELIAPCMPGAQLQEVEGDEYRGVVKVKVGPVTAQYKGVARFLERDEAAHKVVLRAEGRETRGQGNANATITAQLTPDGDGTAVSVVTDLTVTGRVAQFGRGVMADVSAKLLDQFVDCLENKLLVDLPADGAGSSEGAGDAAGGGASGGAGDAAGGGTGPASSDSGERASTDEAATSGPAVKVIDSPDVEAVDLLDAAGAPVMKRAAPVVAGLTALWLLSVFLRRRRRRR